jgi:hypothetical protein
MRAASSFSIVTAYLNGAVGGSGRVVGAADAICTRVLTVDGGEARRAGFVACILF